MGDAKRRKLLGIGPDLASRIEEKEKERVVVRRVKLRLEKIMRGTMVTEEMRILAKNRSRD